jgi:hypothetical protein
MKSAKRQRTHLKYVNTIDSPERGVPLVDFKPHFDFILQQINVTSGHMTKSRATTYVTKWRVPGNRR